jgi:hydroxypyruvate reductase
LSDAKERARGITLLAAGTDGRDGSTDAAGAVVDESTWTAVGSAGKDAEATLRAHESYDALSAANALFKPGPTGTNVMDVVIGLVRA